MNILIKHFPVFLSVCIMVISILTPCILSEENTNNTSIDYIKTSNSLDGYTDLTVHEVWDLVNDTSNGIQYLIDVRLDPEWIQEHIDTPYPEHARHHCKCEWEDGQILQEFMNTYENKEIIIYCKSGGRSVTAANILIDHGFSGTIYNMLGGITLWNNSGYPTVGNRAPSTPLMSGPSSGILDTQYDFIISSNDLDYDQVSFYVKWGDGESDIFQESFPSGEEVIFSHNWTSSGSYVIEVKARDRYFMESDWAVHVLQLSYTELGISVTQSGFGQVSFEIMNIGEYTAENVTSTIEIIGGLFSGINISHSCSGCSSCNSSLAPGENKIETSRGGGCIMGIGSVDITIAAAAENAAPILMTKKALVLGPIIIIQ